MSDPRYMEVRRKFEAEEPLTAVEALVAVNEFRGYYDDDGYAESEVARHLEEHIARVAELERAQKLQRFTEGSMPDVGRYFVAYGNRDEEPTMFEMTDTGPHHVMCNVIVDDPPYGGGGSLESEFEFKYGAMWAYAPDAPDWDVVKFELPLTDQSEDTVEAYCRLCRFRSIVPPGGGPCMGCGRWVQRRREGGR